MADVLTPLVVKTKSAGDIIAKIADATTATQQLAIDASGRVTIASIVNALPTGSNVLGAITQSGTWNVGLSTGTNTVGSVKLGDTTSITQSLTMTSTANAVALAITGISNVGIQITGATWTGTIIFEGTIDGTNWFTINAYPYTVGAAVTTVTANGQWRVLSAGLAQMRVRCSVTGANTATVSLIGTMGASAIQSLGDSIPTGANTLGNVALNTGSNVIGKVSIDQTTPGTTNLVQVGGSLPTGANTIGAVTQASGPWTGNITQVNGTALGSPTAAGASASGNILAVQGVTSGVSMPVTFGAPGTLKSSGQLSGSVASGGGTATLAAAAVTNAKVASLQQITLTSTTPCKWDVQTVNNSSVATTVFSMFTTGAYLTLDWKPQNPLQVQTVSSDGVHALLQVIATNEDNTNTVTAYATIFWSEA